MLWNRDMLGPIPKFTASRYCTCDFVFRHLLWTKPQSIHNICSEVRTPYHWTHQSNRYKIPGNGSYSDGMWQCAFCHRICQKANQCLCSKSIGHNHANGKAAESIHCYSTIILWYEGLQNTSQWCLQEYKVSTFHKMLYTYHNQSLMKTLTLTSNGVVSGVVHVCDMK